MPATIQQDITLCINATGCHFTGPLALRRSLSTVLPILYLCCLVCQQVDFSKNQLVGTLVYSQTHYIYYIFHFLLLFTINISCTAVYLLLFTPFSVTFIRFVNPNNDLPLSIVRSVKH